MFDLAKLRLATEAPARLVLRHPGTREPTGASIMLWSMDSKLARDHNRKSAEARADRRRPLTAAEVDADTVSLLAALTASWSLVAPDGSALDLPFTSENAAELYGDAGCAWIREQVEAFVVDRRNYIPAEWSPKE